MYRLGEIVDYLEKVVPKEYQEDYDNSGLQIGDFSQVIKGVLSGLDCTESLIDEAIAKNLNLVITHHPLFFKSLKSINLSKEVGRIISKAIVNNISIYSIHTNLDNVLFGVNGKIAQKLGLENVSILKPKINLFLKLVVYVPEIILIDGENAVSKVQRAAWNSGAGHIGNYDQCSFSNIGKGTFRGNEDSNPQIGNKLQTEEVEEARLEFICNKIDLDKIIHSIKEVHPYEEVAYDVLELKNENNTIGSGVLGYLPQEKTIEEFFNLLSKNLGCKVVKHSNIYKQTIKKVALCGGSGSFLINDAIRSKADVFITSDLKYHDFQINDTNLLLIDAGHFETEQFTSELISELISKEFTNFAVQISDTQKNPINYFIS
jgi:dinuclear metal center YbgI/SA1388 family protein